MTGSTQTTDADLIAFQRDLVRTGKFVPGGRVTAIAIGPSDNWRPSNEADPFLKKYGRYIDLRGRFLPIAFYERSLVLITAPLLISRGGEWQVGLPDVLDPDWMAAEWTQEEVTGQVPRDPAKNLPRMIPQRLTDRCEMVEGQPAVLQGTDFLIFQPVLHVVFQPEINEAMASEIWRINFRPLGGRHPALLIDHKTGEAHFFGGAFDIERPSGA